MRAKNGWIDSPPLSFVGEVSAESKLIEPPLLLCHFFRGRAVARAVVIDEVTGRILAGSCGIRATDGLQLFMTVAVTSLLRVHGGSADHAVRTAGNEHKDTYEDRRVNTSHSSILSRTVAIIFSSTICAGLVNDPPWPPACKLPARIERFRHYSLGARFPLSCAACPSGIDSYSIQEGAACLRQRKPQNPK